MLIFKMTLKQDFVRCVKLWLIMIFCCIIVFMAEFTWGDLPKSQVEVQLITEYVAQQIEAHEADPEAHLGAGESLQTHRQNEVIDHPAQSVVPDKLFGGDIVIKTQFESLDPWSIVGSITNGDWLGLQATVEYGSVNTSRATSAIYANGYLFDDSSDMYFETQAIWQGSNNHINASVGFTLSHNSSDQGFGFQIRDGALYAHVKRNATVNDLLLSGIGIGTSHFYSAHFSFADQKVYFKVDGVLVATLNVPTGGSWQDDRTPTFYANVTQSNDGTWYYAYLYTWRKVLTS